MLRDQTFGHEFGFIMLFPWFHGVSRRTVQIDCEAWCCKVVGLKL